jgi:hypothetical protein
MATLSASIVLANQVGTGAMLPTTWPAMPRSEEGDHEGDVPADCGAHLTEDERAHGGEDAPQAHPTGRQEAAERNHRERWCQQDVEQCEAQEESDIPGAGEDADPSHEDDEVQECEVPSPGAERQIQAAPQQGDRNDQHGDEDQQRLSLARVHVVCRIGANLRQACQRTFDQPAERGHSPRIHIGSRKNLRPGKGV